MSFSKKTKIVFSLVTVFILSLLLPVGFIRTEASENTITVQTVSGELGETVSLDVMASDIDMAGFQLLIVYEPEYLEPQDAQVYIGEGGFQKNLTYAEDKLAIMWDTAENITVNDMFKVEFEIIEETNGTSEVYIDAADSYNKVLDEDLNEIEVTYVPGGASFTEEPENGNDSSPPRDSTDPCYIATAVYGSHDAPEVVTLRRFRDDVLKESLPGRLFIKAYYALSPPVADYLAEAETLNSWVRNLLDGFVGLINSSSEG